MRNTIANIPIAKSPILASLYLITRFFTDDRKPSSMYSIPIKTFNCDSITKTDVAEEKALITGVEINSNIKPENKENK